MDYDYLNQVRSILGDGTAIDLNQSAGGTPYIYAIRPKDPTPFDLYDTSGAVSATNGITSYALTSDINHNGTTSKSYADLTLTGGMLASGQRALPVNVMTSVHDSLSARVNAMSWTVAAFSSIAVSGGYVGSSYKTRDYLHASLSAPYYTDVNGTSTLSASNGLSEWTLPAGLSANVPLTAVNESCNVESIYSVDSWNDIVGTSLSVPVSSLLSYCPQSTIVKEFSAVYPNGTMVEHVNGVTADFLVTTQANNQVCSVPEHVKYIRIQMWNGTYAAGTNIVINRDGSHTSTVRISISYRDSAASEWRQPVTINAGSASYTIDPTQITDRGVWLSPSVPTLVECVLLVSNTEIRLIKKDIIRSSMPAAPSYRYFAGCDIKNIVGLNVEPTVSQYGNGQSYMFTVRANQPFSASFAYPATIGSGLVLSMMSDRQCNICTVASRQYFSQSDVKGYGFDISHAASKSAMSEYYSNISSVPTGSYGYVNVPVPSVPRIQYRYANDYVVFYPDTACNISILNTVYAA